MFSWLWSRSKDKPRGEPPKFVVPLQPLQVKHGSKVVLEATVRGQPTPRVLWYHLDKEVAPSQEFIQEHDETTGRVSLTIREIFIDDKGLYRCVAVNQYGRDETASYITVEDIEMLEKCELRQAPRITLPLQAQVVKTGSSLDLLARYEAFPPPTIKWYHQGKELKPSRDFVIEHTDDETSLHVDEIFEEDSGEYEVRVFNEAGEARSVATVIVIKPQEVIEMEPPKFVKPLQPQIVPEGEVAILEAEVTAKPEAVFQWYRHGQEITHDEELEVQITSGNNKSTLVLGELFEDDSGDYTVAAENPVGRAASTATLLVEGEGAEEAEPPVFNPPLTPIRVMDGEEVRFSCKVTGKPMPKLTWFQNGRPIGHHREVRLTQTPEGRAGLQILEVFPEDAGDYTCIARNKAGEARTTANLTVESYEYVPDSEQATVTSVSEKNVFSGSPSEEETLEIEKDSESDSEAGSSPYFCNRLEEKIEVKEGTTVRLITKANGYPRPTIKWYVDGSPVEVTEALTVENYEDGTAILTLHKTTLDDCGVYTCEAMNRNGVDTTITTLVVLEEHSETTSKAYRKPEWVTRMEELKDQMSGKHYAPRFTQEITNSRIKEMDTITFTAAFAGNPKPEISWYHNSKIIRQHASYQMRVRNDKAMLTLVQVSPDMKGEYSCRAVNSEGESFTKANLEVIGLTYEEKLKIADERYAAIHIQHAAEHMKEKERERALKEKQVHEEAMAKMRHEKEERAVKRQQELEDAKKNVWKPTNVFEDKKKKDEKKYSTPKERRVGEIYANWNAPVVLEESYPKLQPSEFAPNQIPGVKCFVKVSETSMKGEEVVREVAPQFFEDEQIIHELAKIHTMLKNNVKVSEIWAMFRAGEFMALQQPNIQSALIKVCEYIGHQRNVSIVLAQETQQQALRHPVGLKAFLRMVKHAKNVKPDTLFKETIPKEMGKFSSTTQELTKVSELIRQGIQHEEIIASCEAGKLPTLKKPETQQPLVNIVEKHGHSVMVAQVLVEEAYRDAKDDRLLAEQAWESVHEESFEYAQVQQVRTEQKSTPVPAEVKPTPAMAEQKTVPFYVEQKPTPEASPKPTPVTPEIPKFLESKHKKVPEEPQHFPTETKLEEPGFATYLKESKYPEKPRYAPTPEEPRYAPKPEEPTYAPAPEEPRYAPTPEQPHPTLTPEKYKRVPTQKEPEPTPTPEKSKRAPTQREREPAPTPETPKLKPISREQEPTPSPEKPKLKPVSRETEPAPIPEAPKLKPVSRETETAPVPETHKLKPISREPEPTPTQEKPKLKPHSRETEFQPAPEKPQLKPVSWESEPAPTQEKPKLKPITKEPEPVPSPEKPHLKPVLREAEPTPTPEKPKLKPTPKEHEPAPSAEKPQLKPVSSKEYEPTPTHEKPKLTPVPKEPKPFIPEETKPSHTPEEQMFAPTQYPEKSKPVPSKFKPTPSEPQPYPDSTKPTPKFPKITPVPEETKPTPVPAETKPTPKSAETKPTLKPAEDQPITERKTEQDTPLKIQKEQPQQETVPEQLAETLQIAPAPTPSSVEIQVEEVTPKHTAEKTQVKSELPKVDSATITSVESLQSASSMQVEVRAFELAPPLNVKQGDQLRAVATYVSDSSQENAMHLVEGERVYIHETSNSDWWFVKKHLTLEQGYVPAKLLAEEVSYTHYVQQKLQEKIMKLPVFEKLKKGQKAEAPKMTQMQPMRVKDGQEAQFVCKIQGSPRPNITWFRQTAIIKPSDEFQIFYSDDNTATLIIKEVFPEDAGLFTCVAKNETGYSSSSADLVVEGPVSDHGSSVGASRRSLSRESSVCDILEGIPPTFANKPSVKTVEESTQLEMDVRLVAIPEPEIVWKKDGQVLRESQRVRIVRQKDVHAYRSIFIVKSSKKEDEGKYEIVAKNREGEAKTYITLRVTAPQGPSFDEKYGDQTVEDEGTIRLVARIKGVPAPDVTWSSTFKRGLESCVVEENSEVILECRTSKEKECKWYKGKNELKPSKNITIEREGLTHRLTIHTAVGSDSGRYKCTFDNQSTFCNLVVKGLDDFVERLQDVEVQELEEAVLQVEVSSDKGHISWHKDGEELTNTDRIKLVSQGKVHKLVLKKATLQDEGEYTCVLGDQECTAELTVRELPAEIVRKMKDQVVSKGNKATFEVELTKGDAVITWFKDNKEIRFSDHYQLSIDGKVQRLMVYNCQGDDTGTYRAVVGRSECTATLRVELQAEGDFVTRLPSQMDVNFQSDATFVVEISKDFEVKWFRNQEEIRADQKYIIKKESRKRILIVSKVTQADSGEYSCVLANLKTTCKMNVVLMMSAPKIPKEYQKKEFVVNKGKDVTLKVPFTATPKPKAFWYHKGQLLDTERNQQKILATVTENEASITIKTVENMDCGEYRVKLCNDCGAAYADYTVKILDKPSKPGTPEAMKVTDNSVTIHWSAPKEDGGRVITNYIVEYMSQQQQTWTVFNQNQKITQTTIDVTQLTKDMEYCFRVSAVNEVGTSDKSDQSKFIKVCAPKTAEPPVVKEQLQAVVTGLHQKIVLRCVVTASPPPRIEWMRDGKIIQGETKYENFTATFTIQSSREDSGGMYTCRASNEAGMAECSATVAIQEAPRFEFDETKQCQTLTVGDQWSVPIKVIGYPKPKISWTRNDKPLVSTPHILIHTSEQQCTTSITIQILALEDTAVYTVTAENSAGRAQLSFNLRVLEEEKEYQVCALEVIEEEVKRERPGPPLGPLMVTEVTTASVKLTWKTPSHDGGMAITSYYIEKLEKTMKQWQKVADVGADCRTYTVTDLVEGHEYFFRVFALNPVGISDALEVSQTIVIKSPFDKPGMPIGPFDVSNMTESSLNLHWDEPDSDGGSPITHYVLEKRESNKKAWSKVGQTSADVTNMEVTGLKKGTAYYFRVFAYNAVGQGPPLQPEEPITAGKKITPPSKPNSLQVIDVTTKTVTLAWAPPTTTGGADLMGYVIERRLVNAKWEKVDTVDASVTLYCVENLKEKSEYEFRVFAENPVGLSVEAAMTESVRLKTHAMPPSPPTAPLEVRPTGPTSLMIEWGAPESDGGAPLLGYIIAIRDIKRTMWIEVGQVGANFTRLHIKELQEEHEYFVRVFARNEVGSSDPLEIDEPVKIIRPADFTELPEDDAAPSLSYSTTETLSWMREAGMDADIYSYARGRLLNRDEYFFKVWHRGVDKPDGQK